MPSSSQAKKTRTMDEILGVQVIDFESSEKDLEDLGEHLSPRSSLRSVQQQSMLRTQFMDWMTAIKSNPVNQETETPVLHVANLGNLNFSIRKGIDDHVKENENVIANSQLNQLNLHSDLNSLIVDEKCVKIDVEDIQEEIDFWNSVVICYILGANPPIYVMEGFIRRIWKNMGVDKVASVDKGVFIVRFTTIVNRDKVLNGGFQFFHKKPMIIKAWTPELDLSKEVMRIVPMWIQLHNLDLKYWGERSLFKIAGLIGKVVKTDQATHKRERLQYARVVLVEAVVDQEFPEHVCFQNEKNTHIQVKIVYEWKPELCSNCKQFGHLAANCRRMIGRKVWKPKVPSIIQAAVVATPIIQSNKRRETDEEGFSLAHRPPSRPKTLEGMVPIMNPFQVLTEEEVVVGQIMCEIVGADDGRSDQPPAPNE